MINQEQGSPEWLEWRKGKIGASDATIIMGVSPWMTPFQLWEEKMGLSKPRDTSSAMQRGKDLEKEALKAFEELTGLVMYPKVLQHPEYDWMIASLDGIDFDGSYIVEIKCPGKADHATALEGRIPDKYYPQIQHQLEVAGINKGYYFSFDGVYNACIEFVKDHLYIEELIRKEQAFWLCMQNFEPPELTDRDCLEITDPKWQYLVQEYRYFTQAAKDYDKRSEKIKEELIELAKGQNARGAGLKLMKSFRKGTVDIEALCEFAGVDKELFRKKPTNYWRIT